MAKNSVSLDNFNLLSTRDMEKLSSLMVKENDFFSKTQRNFLKEQVEILKYSCAVTREVPTFTLLAKMIVDPKTVLKRKKDLEEYLAMLDQSKKECNQDDSEMNSIKQKTAKFITEIQHKRVTNLINYINETYPKKMHGNTWVKGQYINQQEPFIQNLIGLCKKLMA